MADDTIIHRTLWDVTKLARPGYDQPDPLFGPQHKPRQPLQGSLSGYQMIGSVSRSVDLLNKPYQDFSKYATVWERNWSTLVDNPDGINSFDPVVGPNDQFSLGYSVVGHIGTVDGSQILVPRGYGGGGKPSLSQILDKGVPAFVSEYTHVWTSTGDWEVFGATEERFTMLTSVDGTIVMLVAYDVVGLVGEDPIMDIIVGKVLTDLGTYAVKKLIGSLVRRVWGPIVAAETRIKLLKEALAKRQGRPFVGELTAEEMTKHLGGILGDHPELRRLMAARVLTDQRLTSATLEALDDWQRLYGRRVVWKSEAEMVARTGNPENLMTHQGNELWINEQAKALKVAKRFHSEVVHELAADSLGIRGVGMAKAYLELPNGTRFTDFWLLENAILKGDVETVVRFVAGKSGK